MEYYVEPRSASDAELAGAIEIRPDTVLILGHVLLPRKAAIPVDPDFCPTRFALDMLDTLATGVHLDAPILLEGHSGIGKNKAIDFLARLVGADLTRFQVCQGSEKHFGSSIENARRSGTWVVVDDVNVGYDIQHILRWFLDKYYRTDMRLNRWHHEPGFRLFGTMCPCESYPGRSPVDPSLIRRWPGYKVLGTPTEVDQAEYQKWLVGDRKDLAGRIVTVV